MRRKNARARISARFVYENFTLCYNKEALQSNFLLRKWNEENESFNL